MSKLKKGAIVSYLFLFAESIFSLILTPLLVRYLGDSEYGIYGLAATISSYILLLDLGVGNALTRYFSKYRINSDIDSQKKLLGVSIIFYCLVSFVAIAVLFITINFTPFLFSKGLTQIEIQRAQIMFWIVGLNSIATLIESPFKRMIIAYEKFALSKGLSLFKVCLRFIIIIFVLYLGGTGFEVLFVGLFLTVAIAIYEVLFVTYRLKILPVIHRVEKSFYIEIFSYSFVVMIQMIAVQINSMVDQVSITILIASATTYLSIYNVGITLTHYYQNIGGAINSLLMPGSVKAIEKKYSSSQILNMMVKFSRIQIFLLGIILVVFAVCGKDFVYLWVGETKVTGYYVALIIMFPQLFVLSQSIGTQLLWALNKHKMQAILQLCVAITNIGLTSILVLIMNPVIGASIGTAVSSLIGNVIVTSYIFKKEIKISIIEYYKLQYKGLLPSLIITLIVGAFFHYLIPISNLGVRFFVSCVFMVIFYFIQILLYGLNSDEKKSFYKILWRRRG